MCGGTRTLTDGSTVVTKTPVSRDAWFYSIQIISALPPAARHRGAESEGLATGAGPGTGRYGEPPQKSARHRQAALRVGGAVAGQGQRTDGGRYVRIPVCDPFDFLR